MLLPDLAAYLETQGIGTRATNLFYSLLPTDPDACVVLFEYGGAPNEVNMGTGTTRLEFPLVQALARGVANDYDGPRLKLQDVVTAFTKVMNQSISASGVIYKAIEAKQAPFFMRRDELFRVYMVVNFHITKDYSTT